MAAQKDINKWYDNFKKQMDARGMDIETEDALRFRIPSADQKSSVALFPDGFVDTPENREKLYDKAKKGEVFFFDKQTQDAYQLGANSGKDCLVDRANAIGMMPQPPGMLFNILNLLTLGLAERFLGKQAEYEKDLKQFRQTNQIPDVGGFTRFLNKITFGLVAHDACMDYDRAMDRIELCHDMERVFRREEGAWREKAHEILMERKQEMKDQKREQELQGVREELENLNQPQNDNVDVDGLPADPQAKAQMLKSQMKEAYEAMKDAFGPNGEGFAKAVEHANKLGVIVRKIKEDPALRAAIGLTEKNCEKFEKMVNTMNDVYQRGLNAKGVLLDHDVYNSKTPEEKEQCIKDLQSMNIVRNMYENMALSKDKFWKEEKKEKDSLLMKQMRKGPDSFREIVYGIADRLDSTNRMKNMTAEEISEYASSPERMSEAIRQDMKQIRAEQAEQEMQNQRILNQNQPEMNGGRNNLNPPHNEIPHLGGPNGNL